MAKSSPRQRRKVGRVMQEYKQGELKSGRRGRGGKVKKRKQAIAIALHEAGLSKSDTKSKRVVAKVKRKVKVKRAKRKIARALVARRILGGKNATKRPVRKAIRRARVKRAVRRTMSDTMH